MALALYRKYRPRTFAEVIGQEHVTEPLSQALRSGPRSGRFAASMGVGTVTMKRLAAASSATSSVMRSVVARSASPGTSPVWSVPDRSAATRRSEMSKPMTGSKCRAKASATGSPT